MRDLPDLQRFSVEAVKDGFNRVFVCACGFEDRALAIPEALAAKAGFAKALVVEYEPNPQENARNRQRLYRALGSLSGTAPSSISYQQRSHVHGEARAQITPFHVAFSQAIELAAASTGRLGITLDITACSSDLLFSILGVLWERDVDLCLVYAEASVYHPTKEEHESKTGDWFTDDSGASVGLLDVSEHALFAGTNPDVLPELLIAFPTFKGERVQAAITELNPVHTVWMIGRPHLASNAWRIDAMTELNAIPTGAERHVVETFGYKETLTGLYAVHQKYEKTHHMALLPLGSKLQNVGVSLFASAFKHVSVYYSQPRSYNPALYTQGASDSWTLYFGSTVATRQAVAQAGTLELRADP